MGRLRRAIVFDLDDTLYPEREFVLSGFRAVEAWVRNQYQLEGFYQAAAKEFEQGARGNIFDLALRHLGIESTPELLKELVHIYRGHAPVISLFPDAKEALIRVQQSSWLALITDGYHETQAKKVSALGLEKFLQHVVYSDLLGRAFWKPHPSSYEQVMKRFQCVGGDCVYVADNPNKDFITAKKLGWQTVRVRRPGGEHSHITLSPEYEAHLEISNLNQLPY
jgi:putative hydrolase of the HAD superfamily